MRGSFYVIEILPVSRVKLCCRSEIRLLGIEAHFNQAPVPLTDILLLLHYAKVAKAERESIARVRVLFGLCIEI